MTTLVTAPHRKHRGRKNGIVHSNPSNTSQWRIAMKNRICYHQIHRHIRKPLLLCLVFILRFVCNLSPTTFLQFIVMFQFTSSLKTFNRFFNVIVAVIDKIRYNHNVQERTLYLKVIFRQNYYHFLYCNGKCKK